MHVVIPERPSAMGPLERCTYDCNHKMERPQSCNPRRRCSSIRARLMSALPSTAARKRTSPGVRVGPTTDIVGALDTVNSLYEEPSFSGPQGCCSPPPAAPGAPSPTRAVSEQRLHAVLSLIRRTRPRSSVPLPSRPAGNRFGQFPTNTGPRRFPDGLLCRRKCLSHSCPPEAMHMPRALPNSHSALN
jgi:hypothetical protein